LLLKKKETYLSIKNCDNLQILIKSNFDVTNNQLSEFDKISVSKLTKEQK